MKKDRIILILGILIIIMPFLGIPNLAQDWIISISGLVIVAVIILRNYFSVKNNAEKVPVKEQPLEAEEEIITESVFVENGLENNSEQEFENVDEGIEKTDSVTEEEVRGEYQEKNQ